MNRFILFFTLSLLALTPFASADIPHLISLQGRLTDASNNPLTSTANFVFRIYASQTGGTPAWTETQNSIPLDTLGIFSVLLGSANALSIPFDSSYWLEVQVQSGTGPAQVLSPRQRLGSAGYALRSENPWNATGNDIYTTNAGNVGIGTASPGAKLDVQGGNIQTSGTITAASFSGAGTGLTGTASGLTSGSANNVPWSGVSGKPTSITRIQDLTGSYGSLNIAGATNAYGGIKFPDAGNFILMVRNDGLSGIYNEGSGWKWYFDNNGVLTAGTVPWARLSSYPSACPAGQYASAVGASLTCGAPAGGISGSGTANYLPKWTGGTSLGNSVIYDNGNVGIGTASPGAKLDVAGTINAGAMTVNGGAVEVQANKNVANGYAGLSASAKYAGLLSTDTAAKQISTQTDKTGVRAFGINYQNTIGTPMFVSITVTELWQSTVTFYTDSSISPTTVVSTIFTNDGTTTKYFTLFAIVLPGNYYRLDASGAGSYGIYKWFEWY